MSGPEGIILSISSNSHMLSVNVAEAEDIDDLDPGDYDACSDFVKLIKDCLHEMREGAEDVGKDGG